MTRYIKLMSVSVFLSLFVVSCLPAEQRKVASQPMSPNATDLEFYPGDYSDAGVIGNSLPGSWRPFSDESPWNSPIPDDAVAHPASDSIMKLVSSKSDNIRFINRYLTPIWVVNSANAKPASLSLTNEHAESHQSMDLHLVTMRSKIIFDRWDTNNDGLADHPIPLAKGMYPEPSRDGHICIVDPFKKESYELSKYYGWKNDPPECTTFNIWDLKGSGVGDPLEGKKWWARGGKGSGFPLIAGILRPEEVLSGNIRHALTFTFSMNRRDVSNRDIMIHPPACRSDGRNIGEHYPIEGMRFQLNPSLTSSDFEKWGLTAEGVVLAKALQKYGMFLGDNGGDMAIGVQLLGSTERSNRKAWDELIPGFYKTVTKIPVDSFRVVYTGEPTVR